MVVARFPPFRLLFAAALTLALLLTLWPAPGCRAAEVFPLTAGESCLDCHDDLLAQPYKHGAIDDSADCLHCHRLADPAEHAPVLPGKNVATLCFECHDSFAGAGSAHGPAAAGECTACHNPHSAAQPKLLLQEQPRLCFICHGAPVDDDQGIRLPPTKRQFEDNQSALHPPFADGGCGDCHHPHASDHPRLLVAAYPAGLYQTYAPAAYGLCFNCHDDAAFSQPRTLNATAFRNGNLNLHQRHVNKKKGRSCRACHNPHGSRLPHLITAGFRFGERALGVGFELTENGGTCTTACHIKVTYDRLSPVQNPLRTTPRQGTDADADE